MKYHEEFGRYRDCPPSYDADEGKADRPQVLAVSALRPWPASFIAPHAPK